ncbi:MAG TPA: hypothetical protein VHK88_19995 [Aquihabitans sp.]|jgi:hypothetical protein|nr:hypothetical protein [Aquihabitans sp.]
MTDTRPARPLRRQRDCDLATSHDLAALDDAGITYEIVETSGQATTLCLSHVDLHDLADVLRRGDVATTDHPLKKILDEIEAAAEEAEAAADQLKWAARDLARDARKAAA